MLLRLCIVGVVATNEYNMTSYFSKARNLNGSNADMCSDVAGPLSSGVGDLGKLLDFGSSSRSPLLLFAPLLAAILDLSVTTTPILLFGVSYVIKHKVYSWVYSVNQLKL